MSFRAPVAVRRGWVAEGPGPVTSAATSEELTSEISPQGSSSTHEPQVASDSGISYQLSRTDDEGWRATLPVPEDVNSMDDIVLDLGEREMHTTFKGRAPHILEFPIELRGVPADAWKVRFSRKRRELSLEISGFDAKVVAELGMSSTDLTPVMKPVSSSTDDRVVHNTTPQGTSKKDGYFYDGKPAEACATEGWTKPQETSPGTYDSWNTKNAPYGDGGRADEFDKKVSGFASKVSQVSNAEAQQMMQHFGNDIKSKKKPGNSGLMFDQNGGQPQQMEIDPEAVDAAGALMAHSMIAVNKCEKLSAIIDAGVKVDTVDEMGCTLLEKACLWGHVDIVKMLLAKGAYARGLAHAPSTPLHRACAYSGSQSQQMVRMLLKAGANKHRKDSSGRTAADIAQASGNLICHQLVLAAEESENFVQREADQRQDLRSGHV